MARKTAKQLAENQEVIEVDADGNPVNEDSSAAATLHAGGGSAGSGSQPRDVEPSNFQLIARAMGALGSVDKSTLKYFTQQIETHTAEHLGKGVGNVAGKNAASLNMKPSDAVGSGGNRSGASSAGTGDVKPGSSPMKEMYSDEVKKLLESVELPQEFKDQAATLFEAALEARVIEETAIIRDQYEEQLNEEVDAAVDELNEKVANYVEYIAEKWLDDNTVQIESALRSEVTADFMSKLRDLFIECNINLPEDSVEVVDELAAKVEELEGRLAEAITENAELRKIAEVVAAEEVVESAAEGLTMVEANKLRKLSEGLDFEDLPELEKKVNQIRESIKPTKKPSKVGDALETVDPANRQLLGEEVQLDEAGNVIEKPEDKDLENATPEMKRYVRAIEGTKGLKAAS
jgi:hypothetical protein